MLIIRNCVDIASIVEGEFLFSVKIFKLTELPVHSLQFSHLRSVRGVLMIVNGGFAEYCAYPQGKVFPVTNLSDVDATLLEPASCAAHGLEKIAPKVCSVYNAFFENVKLMGSLVPRF